MSSAATDADPAGVGAGNENTVATSAALHAVGAVLGIPVTTTEHDEWELDERGLRVGLGWYLQRGHGAHEAIALAALQLWEGPRDAALAPARTRRRRTIAQARPALVPLLGAVHRTQAVAELLRFMPGVRVPLRAAVQRALPGDLTTIPRHLQWAALVLARQSSAPESFIAEDPAVAEEWKQLGELGGAEISALPYVLAPDPEVPALRRFERALALLLPAYERLLELDLAEHSATVLGGGERAEQSLQSEQPLGSDDFGILEDDQTEGESSEPDEPDEPTEPDEQTDTPTDAAPSAADLFASEHESFATTVLSTPIPDASALFDAAVQVIEIIDSDRSEMGDTGASGPGDTGSATILVEYRSKVAQLAGSIDAMRALWTRIIAERVAPRRSQSRTPMPEGDELAGEALATVVAAALAGVRGPNAFLSRVVKPRLARSVGSTDYVLVVDRSASMSGAAAEAAADAALIMIEALAAVERDVTHAERTTGIDLELDIRTSLIVFDAEAVVVKPLSRGLDDGVRRRLHGEVRTPSGATNDAAALRAAGEQLGVLGQGAFSTSSLGASEGVRRRRIAILVSDGGSNDAVAAQRELRRLRAAGVTVHGIGVGAEDLAVRYAPHGVSIADPRQLPSALERVIKQELG